MQSLVKPIRELEEAAQKMSVGDFSSDITYESEDELGELANQFRTTSEEVRLIISDLHRILCELTDGNFDVRTECREKYTGDFAYQ